MSKAVEGEDHRLCPDYIVGNPMLTPDPPVCGKVARPLRHAFFRSRGSAWLGDVLLNSLALVLSTRSPLHVPQVGLAG